MAKKATRSQAVMAPVRRWLLYSPTRLGVVVAAIVVTMVVIGQFMPAREHHGALSSAAADDTETSTTEVVVKAGAEVTPDQARAIDDQEAAKSPQVIAMKYALAYTDINPTTGEWINTLSRYAAPGAIAGDVVANRPVVPIAVSGQTSSTSHGQLVIVTTSAGDMSIRLESDGSGWRVTTPLPTLDDVGASAVTTSDPDDVPATSGSDTANDVPTTQSESSTTDAGVPSALLPSTTAPASTPTTDPRPAPGPIPTPSLEGPLPGPR